MRIDTCSSKEAIPNTIKLNTLEIKFNLKYFLLYIYIYTSFIVIAYLVKRNPIFTSFAISLIILAWPLTTHSSTARYYVQKYMYVCSNV